MKSTTRTHSQATFLQTILNNPRRRNFSNYRNACQPPSDLFHSFPGIASHPFWIIIIIIKRRSGINPIPPTVKDRD